ncbi:enoyl-CoA hydratase [Erythrobacter ani]|uniref:Enoyl-CoA hydratase n=1 Tax=Erythrobacter ani TaxID=2827235 RepID=A0ABS6SNQ5_9SPHN|nr:enoyl-CoA hydratase [Erythrobacter ani]MBV7266137.1 enoyl-CoA hydratase [Erythrobacter ani]
MTDFIRVEHADRITTVTLARADKKNAITQAMYAAMADAVNAYGTDDDARALMFIGEGDYFTSGNDLKDFAMAANGGADNDDLPPVIRFLHAIKDCRKPLIAAVNGPAIGVGLTLTLHCDLVYAAESATFAAPFVKLGLVPEAASSMLLPAAIGMAAASDVFMTGRILESHEALRMGLVSRVFADSDFASEARTLAATVAQAAPQAMRHTKALMRTQTDTIGEVMETEGKIFADQLRSPEFMESVSAMAQKRAAVHP